MRKNHTRYEQIPPPCPRCRSREVHDCLVGRGTPPRWKCDDCHHIWFRREVASK